MARSISSATICAPIWRASRSAMSSIGSGATKVISYPNADVLRDASDRFESEVVISLGAQGPDDAFAIEQEIERVSDVGHEDVGAHNSLDGAAFTRLDGDRQPAGIPGRREPQPVIPAVAENG